MQIQIFNTSRSSFSIYLLSKPVLIETRLLEPAKIAVLAADVSRWHSVMADQVRRCSFNKVRCCEKSLADGAHSEKHVLMCMEAVEKYGGSCSLKEISEFGLKSYVQEKLKMNTRGISWLSGQIHLTLERTWGGFFPVISFNRFRCELLLKWVTCACPALFYSIVFHPHFLCQHQ